MKIMLFVNLLIIISSFCISSSNMVDRSYIAVINNEGIERILFKDNVPQTYLKDIELPIFLKNIPKNKVKSIRLLNSDLHKFKGDFLNYIKTKGIVINLNIGKKDFSISDLVELLRTEDESQLIDYKLGFFIFSNESNTFVILLNNCTQIKLFNQLSNYFKKNKNIKEGYIEVSCGLHLNHISW